MDLTTLGWGERDGHKLAAPVIELDHNTHRFVGGRWILVACEPDAGFFSNTKLLSTLADLAVRHGDGFTLRPRVPLFVAGDPIEIHFERFGPEQEERAADRL